MRKLPGWYEDALERHAMLILEDGETRDQAMTSLRMLIRDEHREFGNVVIDDWNGPRLSTAIDAFKSRRAAEIRAALKEAEAEAVKSQPVPVAPAVREAPSRAFAHAPVSAQTKLVDERMAALHRELEKIEPPADEEWELHHTLFPDFPFRSLRITPERYQKIHKMTAHELDMARNVLYAKTGNAIKGAEDERRIFDSFYNKVRPLMQADDTVADAERALKAHAEQVVG